MKALGLGLLLALALPAVAAAHGSGGWDVRTSGPRLGMPADAVLRAPLPGPEGEHVITERMALLQRRARSQFSGTGKDGPVRRAVTHLAGSPKLLSGGAPSAQLRRTGFAAGEPTMGVNSKGTLFFVGFGGLQQSSVIRSRDGGEKWEQLNPLTPAEGDGVTFDPFIWLDKSTDRLFNVDLSLVACSTVSSTDDEGDTWNQPAGQACHSDHQNLFAGPPASSTTVGYPNVVYYCAIDGGAFFNFGTFTGCSKSLDGGTTFAKVTPPFTNDPTRAGGHYGVPGHCGGNVGHGAVGPDGTVYLPRGWCDRPYIAVSEDEGLTWERIQVADVGMAVGSQLEEHEANVAVDADGTVYYTWIAVDRLPYLTTSKDRGRTWSKPVPLAAPGVNEAWNVTLDAGDPGRIAFSYIGTTNSPGGPFCVRTTAEGCELEDGGAYEGDYGEAKTAWHAYMGLTVDALAAQPVLQSAIVNDPATPLMRGIGCGPSRCDVQYDFLDTVVGPDGTAWAAYVDGLCEPDPEIPCTGAEGAVGHLYGGPPLIGPLPAEPGPAPAPPAPAPATPAPAAKPAPRCNRRKRLVIRRVRSVKVNGRRVKVRRHRAVIRLRRYAGRRITVRTVTRKGRKRVRRVRVCR